MLSPRNLDLNNLRGVANDLEKHDRFLFNLERMKLKFNLPFIKLQPHTEMMLIIMNCTWMRHKINSMISEPAVKTDIGEFLDGADTASKDEYNFFGDAK
jgi:hypothetical protein